MSETIPSFEARMFSPGFGNEAVQGRIYLEPWAFRFRSPQVTMEIPMHHLRARMTGGEHSQLCFFDRNKPDIHIFTSDESILNHRTMRDVVLEQLSEALGKRDYSRRLKLTCYFFAACFLITCIAYWITGAMVRSLVSRVPASWEAEFGDRLLGMVADEVVIIKDTNCIVHLQKLTAPLLAVIPKDGTKYKFHLIEMEQPNAFALPGGHVFVTTGLLDFTDSPEELLGVLAHELAHVTKRHGLRKIISAAGPLLIFQVFLRGGNGLPNLLGNGSQLLILRSFSQEFEAEADDVGWKYLVAANIDPRGMITTFQKFKNYESTQRFVDGTPQAFRSHPALEKRIARLEVKWRKLSKKDGFIELHNDKALRQTVYDPR